MTSSIEIDELFKQAAKFYYDKKFIKCQTILDKVNFNRFDFREWVLENNKLLCNLKKNANSAELCPLLERFQSLIQRIQGLPPQETCLTWELVISFNYSFLLLCCHDMIGSCHKACVVLTNSIIRALKLFGSPCPGVMSESTATLSDTCQSLLQSIMGTLSRSLVPAPVILSCLMLAIVWISLSKVSEATKLLEALHYYLEQKGESSHRDQETFDSVVLRVDPALGKDVFPLSLLGPVDSSGCHVIEWQVSLLLAICHFYQKEQDKAFNLLRNMPQTSEESAIVFYWMYLKGLIHFEKESFGEALACLSVCETNTDEVPNSHKAAVDRMIGRCLSKKGRHHTAIARLKQALVNSLSPDAMLDLALEFEHQGKTSVEFTLLRSLIQVLSLTKTAGTPSLLCGGLERFTHALDNRTVSLQYASYHMARRCLEEKRFEEAANAFLDVLVSLADQPISEKPVLSTLCFPPMQLLYRDCALALLCARRYEDCLTICDHISESYTDRTEVAESENSMETASGVKRPRIPSTDSTADYRDGRLDVSDMELALYKAWSLWQMELPLPSLECLHRLLQTLDGLKLSPLDKEYTQRTKRRKLDSSEQGGVDDGDHMDKHTAVRHVKVTYLAQAHLCRALVMQSLQQDKDSLEELTESLTWHPDSTASLYHHTALLFKFDRGIEAARNWLTHRGLVTNDQPQLGVSGPFFSSTTGIPESLWISEHQIKQMDTLALQPHK
ncbi:uncharacterized protein LOC116617051 isoform X2 [Nematostella vectensis]|uniref:uncharacterized protein LOC116617051 isoform X2 n=1 Tax=Nematostella vectensis TaxID=45351 RepID=UPI0020772D10|nr:uncharacterized protein LOC116617051 isoform X2 [Nematostella vectensis]